MKQTNNRLNVSYDKEADVLYLSQGEPSSHDETSETADEIVIRKNAKTGEIKGMTILHFLKRSMDKATEITLPFQFSFK
jgi:uncharacterized protein YuzE